MQMEAYIFISTGGYMKIGIIGAGKQADPARDTRNARAGMIGKRRLSCDNLQTFPMGFNMTFRAGAIARDRSGHRPAPWTR